MNFALRCRKVEILCGVGKLFAYKQRSEKWTSGKMRVIHPNKAWNIN